MLFPTEEDTEEKNPYNKLVFLKHGKVLCRQSVGAEMLNYSIFAWIEVQKGLLQLAHPSKNTISEPPEEDFKMLGNRAEFYHSSHTRYFENSCHSKHHKLALQEGLGGSGNKTKL